MISGVEGVLATPDGGVFVASAGALARKTAVEKAIMLIGYRLSLYTFVGAKFRAPPFPGPSLSFHYNAGSIGDVHYQQLSIRRNEN